MPPAAPNVRSKYFPNNAKVTHCAVLRTPLHEIMEWSFLKNLIDFAQAVEPLLKTTVPHVISAFDELEQKGLLGLVTKFPAKVDLSQAQEVGLFGMLQAMREKEIRQGLGVLLELTRGLSAVKV